MRRTQNNRIVWIPPGRARRPKVEPAAAAEQAAAPADEQLAGDQAAEPTSGDDLDDDTGSGS